MALLVSCLEGPALNWLKPFYQSDPDGVLVTSSKFVEEITKQYGDSHKEVTAGINLKTLRQGNRSVAAYASDFRNLVHDLGFNDAALRYHFREGYSPPKSARQPFSWPSWCKENVGVRVSRLLVPWYARFCFTVC